MIFLISSAPVGEVKTRVVKLMDQQVASGYGVFYRNHMKMMGFSWQHTMLLRIQVPKHESPKRLFAAIWFDAGTLLLKKCHKLSLKKLRTLPSDSVSLKY